MGAALSLDHYVTLLNITAASCEPSIRSTGGAKLTQEDVYGALGLGNLSNDSKVIGLAVYCGDARMVREATLAAVRITAKTFSREEWSATSPFRKLVNDLVRDGKLPQELAASEKEQRGKQLIVRMAKTALDEMLSSDKCRVCSGTGFIKGVVHHKCAGSGVSSLSGADIAESLGLTDSAVKMTWAGRYRYVNYQIMSQLLAFNGHLVKYVGRDLQP